MTVVRDEGKVKEYTASMSFRSLLKTSRPRFWVYLFGPALIGLIAALKSGGEWSIWSFLLLFVFTFPANLFIYGVNDVFDQETDRLNPKKQGYEQLFDPKQTRFLFQGIFWSFLPFILGLFFAPRGAVISFLLFIFLGGFYSAPPIRAKIRPFVDAAFNALYLMPALVAWFAFGGGALNWSLVIAGIAWCMAMHAYSAAPDIEADQASGLQTVATLLGRNGTIRFCLALYLVAAGIGYLSLGLISLLLVIPYIVLMELSTRTHTSTELSRVYRFFPWINTLVGFCLFWWIALAR